ncbi:pentatricopeptide repeat-containing protein At1g05600 [Malania oleifera]|uniref:pentatricopeptide repeat-containing protein At1g05600 n=1 Tax=Malania oleifera TaxID=397392 RepID=UPI0025ADC98F|nr:pentatricopeptide repeat-containing protein At1g05600 [Malania oleifera]XP_057980583.1 pentatricopeptide repeat-containing protein At1g05600 [Malania oleifera]XP_057980585.1 pentatricopeptide repeat-containing protein At1g05600 [Malania oleifera]XP_057980586.1 pentatricopeptide repeat-containing protein At1g05600 [Malania oleifera]XP_057980587.1 pentatricopeptide repeat-containing protein At1g05600 [Malania oleifera]XP_057980588.1 pentatricopeptide repeat-containing protein At1g05600 [Malan
MTVRWPRLLTPPYLCQIIRKQKNPLTALRIFKVAKSKYPNYSHNGPAYATMINILGNSGRIMEMKEVIDLMKDDSCECKDSVLTSAIKFYANAGLLDEAVSLFRNLPQFNCVNWTESFITLMRIMVKESKLETTHRVLLESSYGWEVRSRTRSLNVLMDALCWRNHSDLALQIFQEMSYQCCHPDRETYRILMRGLCEDGRMNEATHLLYSMFWRISQKGSGEDVVIYKTLLNALCDNGQVQDAADILAKVLRKGLKAPKRCCKRLDLEEHGNVEDVQHVKALINESLIKGMIPSMASYSAMAVDLYSQGKIDDANRVLDEMHEGGFRASLSIYEAKIAALCSEGRMIESMEVIGKEMKEYSCVPTVKVYNIVMKGLCDERKSDLAFGFLEKMNVQLGCVPNKETYDILVDGLCHDGKFVEASRVLEEMLIKSYWPGVDTYNTLIRGLCFVGRKYEAVVWLEEMVSQCKTPNPFVWNALVASVCTSDMAEANVYARTLDQLMSFP